MRYAQYENPIAAAVLPAAGSVTVQVLRQDTNTVLALSSNVAVESAIPGIYQFPLSNITTPITGFAQLVVVFSHNSGGQDYAKLVVRGVVDEITKIRKLLGAVL